ncbi:MAG TPA: hypothetical protein VK249_27475 [Anaerolineales bacterium]|nr:hypothetical protein [Anaerolineales bacterium]
MSNDLRDQIYNELNLRETEDLLEIWQTNDHEEWSETAFEVIKGILIERLGEVPPQELPGDEQEEEEILEDDGLEKWEAQLLDDKSQPEFYDTLEVITLKDSINKTAKAVIVVYALANLINIQGYVSLAESYFVGHEGLFTPLIYFLAFIFVSLNAAVSIAIVYFPLKALTYILRILMEMEFNSRKGIKPDPLAE